MTGSLRRTLLTFYAGTLVVVIGTFCALLYEYRRQTLFDRIDTELRAHATAVAGSVEWDPAEGYELEIGVEYGRHFGGDGPYLLIVTAAGETLYRSPGAPESDAARVPGFRDRAGRREYVAEGGRGVRVLVGLDTAGAREELAEFLRVLLSAAGAVLVLAVAGGWLLVRGVLRPIRRMTEAAEAIAGRDPGRRIDIEATKSELGRLATTLNDAFDRLQEAAERQARFTADASHELRTPLSVLISNAEAGLRRDRSPGEYREVLARCLRAGRRMTEVVQGLLVLARSDADGLPLSRSELDLAEIVAAAIELLAPVAEEKDVAVKSVTEPVTVFGDAERLRHAVGNVIANAIRYNLPGGRVDVTLAREGAGAVLTVSDTGVGIPPEERARVFERFYRVDSARSRDAGGSGLGLSIAKEVVRAHGGSVDLAGREDGGTVVTIRLPVRPEDPRDAPLSDEPPTR